MRRALAVLAAVHLLASCTEKPAPSEPARPTETSPVAPAPSPQPPPPPGEGASGAPAAAPAATPAPAPARTPAPTRAPVAAKTPVAPPAPAATPAPQAAAGHTAVGSDRCKACHRIQYSSWAASAHPAKRVDCESCHGPGSDYVSIKVMKDPVAARAAGLVMPKKERCLPCHASKWSDDMLGKAHAHKPK